MKKVFFFLAFLLFLVASCSNQNDHEQDKHDEHGDSSSSDPIINSSAGVSSSSRANISSSATQSSSSIETQSSSDGDAMLSSSDVATQSSSSNTTQSSSGGATGGLTCQDPVSTTATDYSDMKNWSVFTAADKLTEDVDIFLLYPTSIQSSDPEDCPYARINNSSMRRSVDQWYSGIKSVVTSNANVYLPYYRQANVFGSGCSGANMTGGAAMEDVIASFQYYLTHINKGQRPFMTLG
ncbi:MAG: DUF3089 domain-containing protein, partial [Fibromonadaceae bacterium]|nr:DUF3089 domain-containing protein [Fibromonadaceae bacterium]